MHEKSGADDGVVMAHRTVTNESRDGRCRGTSLPGVKRELVSED